MTTALSVLNTRLGVMIGDATDETYLASYPSAINNASRELYPILYKKVIDDTLITGNILPPFIWSSSSALKIYAGTNATLEKTTTAGLVRNGETSAKVTADAANGYLSIDSDNYPRLLDLMNITIDYKNWAEPEVANDAFLTIAYEDADASETTVSSTTTCPASVMTRLQKTTQIIPDNITKIGFRMRVATNTKYAYFDYPRVTGKDIYEYLLPDEFQNGDVKQVYIQIENYSDDACDDLRPRWKELFGWGIIHDGTYKYLSFDKARVYLPSKYKLRLIGTSPLEDTLSSDTDTISLDGGGQIQLLLSYAAYLLFEMVRSTVSSDSIDKYDREVARWLGKVEMLKPQHRMPRLSSQIGWTI